MRNRTTFVFSTDSPGRKVLGKLVHPLHGFFRMDVVFRALFCIFNRNMYSVYEGCFGRTVSSTFFVCLFSPVFLRTAFSASLGAGRMKLKRLIFFIVLILHVDNIKKAPI